MGFKCAGPGLIGVHVLKEDSIATTNRPATVSLRVKRKTDSWRGVEQVSLGASRRLFADATLHPTIEQIRAADQRSVWIQIAGPGNVGSRIPVPRVVIALALGPEQAEA